MARSIYRAEVGDIGHVEARTEPIVRPVRTMQGSAPVSRASADRSGLEPTYPIIDRRKHAERLLVFHQANPARCPPVARFIGRRRRWPARKRRMLMVDLP